MPSDSLSPCPLPFYYRCLATEFVIALILDNEGREMVFDCGHTDKLSLDNLTCTH
jgi:hypothetical protein